MLNRKIGLMIAVAVVCIAAAATVYGFTRTDSQSCGPHAVTEAKAQHGNDRLRVINPPPGSVASGGGQRIEVEGHQATLHGPGQLSVRCAK